MTVQDIIKVLMANAEKAARLVARLASDFPREHEPCPIGSDRALDNALITAPEARDAEAPAQARRRCGPGARQESLAQERFGQERLGQERLAQEIG